MCQHIEPQATSSRSYYGMGMEMEIGSTSSESLEEEEIESTEQYNPYLH